MSMDGEVCSSNMHEAVVGGGMHMIPHEIGRNIDDERRKFAQEQKHNKKKGQER